MLWQKYAKIRNETITLGNYIISALVLIYIPSCSYSSDIPKFHKKIRFKKLCKVKTLKSQVGFELMT